MIKSMTGYGLASHETENVKIVVEVKTLNSKFLDLSLKLPRAFSDKELFIRKLISDRLERGKVGLSVDYLDAETSLPKLSLNEDLFKAYYDQLKKLSVAVNAETSDIFKIALQSPDVMTAEPPSDANAKNWDVVLQTIEEALEKCNEFRTQEGATLQEQIASSINTIGELLQKVGVQDPHRTETIRARIKQNIEELSMKGVADENRLEQEIIFYVEKLDISEEKVRLKSHLDYFLEMMEQPNSQGKKLGFISQEIGREINTIGSKANDALIQKYVVGMKEELEKIKEQLLNII